MSTPDETTPIPPVWRALGYQPLSYAFRGAPGPISDLRKHWLAAQSSHEDRSSFTPRPDVVIIAGERREPLPGWCHETVNDWLQEFAAGTDWTPRTPSYDPRVLALVDSNRSEGFPSGASLPVNPPLVTLGYAAAAEFVTSLNLTDPRGRPVAMGASYMRRVWMTDLTRGWHAIAPIPDAIVAVGSQHIQLPGWTQETLRNWPQTRQTPGNWSYGDQRAKRKVDLPDQRELTGQAT